MLCDRRDELSRTRTQAFNRLHRLFLDLIPGGAPVKKSTSRYQASRCAAQAQGCAVANQARCTARGPVPVGRSPTQGFDAADARSSLPPMAG
jgi:hypothetical protein